MKDIKDKINNNRIAIRPSWVEFRDVKTDRQKELPKPQMFKTPKPNAKIIELSKDFPNITQKTLTEVIKNRRSTRQYKGIPLSIEEVTYLLWETSRVDYTKKTAVFRSIPTGGATNAMETYIYINNVQGIDKGLYHYLQDVHKLALIDDEQTIEKRANEALFRQLRGASVVIILTAIPYRSEYKYSFTAHKMIAIEAGHAGQNLSLAAEVINAGACCLAAYNQDLLDEFLQVDGEEEFATYAITIGKK